MDKETYARENERTQAFNIRNIECANIDLVTHDFWNEEDYYVYRAYNLDKKHRHPGCRHIVALDIRASVQAGQHKT
jgi:hypothetical protein